MVRIEYFIYKENKKLYNGEHKDYRNNVKSKKKLSTTIGLSFVSQLCNLYPILKINFIKLCFLIN